MMLTEMQTDTELDRVQKETLEKEQETKYIMRTLSKESSRVSWDGTLVSLRGLLGLGP